MAFITEAQLEAALMSQLDELGYACTSDDIIGPDGKQPERTAYDEVLLIGRLSEAVARLNPGLPEEAKADVMRRLTAAEFPTLLEENRRIHRLMIDGVDVEFFSQEGVLTADKAKLIDFYESEKNDWLAVQQLTVVSGQVNRRPDVVLYLNGLPIAVVELKAPGGQGANLVGAYNQLQTYKSQIASLFHTNTLLVTSDGIAARVGSLSSDIERFMPWRTTNGYAIAPKGAPELSTLIEGVFEKRRVLPRFYGHFKEAS